MSYDPCEECGWAVPAYPGTLCVECLAEKLGVTPEQVRKMKEASK